MTDRVKTLVVHLNDRIRVDDVEIIVDAIRMIRHVDAVELMIDDGFSREMAVEEAKRDLRKQLFEVLNPDLARVLKGKQR